MKYTLIKRINVKISIYKRKCLKFLDSTKDLWITSLKICPKHTSIEIRQYATLSDIDNTTILDLNFVSLSSQNAYKCLNEFIFLTLGLFLQKPMGLYKLIKILLCNRFNNIEERYYNRSNLHI